MTTLPPSYHACDYAPDDNRFDMRPFLYPTFTFAYEKIEKFVREWENLNPDAAEAMVNGSTEDTSTLNGTEKALSDRKRPISTTDVSHVETQ